VKNTRTPTTPRTAFRRRQLAQWNVVFISRGASGVANVLKRFQTFRCGQSAAHTQ